MGTDYNAIKCRDSLIALFNETIYRIFYETCTENSYLNNFSILSELTQTILYFRS